MEKNKYGYWVGIVIVLALIAWGLSSLSPEAAPQGDDLAAGGTRLGMLAEPNAIFIFDQKPAEALVVTNVFFDPEGQGGFVVIHRDENGAPGNIIGTSFYVEPGEYIDLPVDLTASVENGEVLYAMLHSDDGDQEFDAQKDAPIQSTVLEGPIMGRFVIDENAEAPAAAIF